MEANAARMLAEAKAQGYALGAFNAVNLETAQAIVRGAEAERTPVILMVSENAARYAGLEALAAACKVLKKRASVPVLLHFDHAESLASATKALELGFDAVMLEGAGLGLEENLRRVQALVKLAHAQGVAVEAEVEVVHKPGRPLGGPVTPRQMQAFAAASGADSLAANLGTAHKQTHKTAQLDFARLADIAARIPLPLVLHGGSSVPEAELKRAVRGGVAKVNVSTELMLAFTDAVRTALRDPELHDPRRYLGEARAAMEAEVRRLLRLLRP